MLLKNVAVSALLLLGASIGEVALARPVHVVVNVDVMPDNQAAGEKLLLDYIRQARRDPKLSSVTLIQEQRAANHYILDEVFTDQDAYSHHAEMDYVRNFRTKLHSNLGSPWDERSGLDIEP
jgi:quinol monooxygenase YgiN